MAPVAASGSGHHGDGDGARADFEAGRAALREGDPPSLVESLHRGLPGTD
ncbi:hypothetical protein MEBOL_003472 [Melittangium boletus DSM 14713]|uniref:Uncharacterized protein n=1 Tax=Melittangium boletus DSM 14713 TaxID=1294270 RepID=A0A250IFS7_9BACT|nr:hypothetical protein MEBOL_003472 [Melittangium boletus DSM 14713]